MAPKLDPTRTTEVGSENIQGDERDGIDELNLAEFPLAAISDRMSDGIKTVTLEDSIFDRVERRQVTRRIVLSGSDQYGLPTAKDDDVLLACIQISKQQDFRSPETQFTRYEILKLLGWPDESKYYARVAKSMRRWKGLSVFSDRAFYDFAQKSWVNRDFGIFDSLYMYRKESDPARNTRTMSRFTWNDVLFRSFQAGYLKRIDWRLYTSLRSPIAKRLYRLLDKRFYHASTVELDLCDLAFRKLRLSNTYHTGQIKRAIRSGIEELEQCWQLKSIPDSRRYQKHAAGRWTIRFERKPQRGTQSSSPKAPSFGLAPPQILSQCNPVDLQIALSKRGIGPSAAEELSTRYALESIQVMIELYDWYNGHGQPRGVGFLIESIRKPDAIAMPKGFQSSVDRKRVQLSIQDRKRDERAAITKREAASMQRENNRRRALKSFWNAMSPSDQTIFESNALDKSDATKRRGYFQHQGKGGKLFEQYRYVILLDHFERTKCREGKST